MAGPVRTRVVESISEVDREQWNGVVRAGGGTPFHSHQWLSAYEEAGPHESTALHVLAYDGDRLAGVLPAYLTAGCPRLKAHREYVVSRPTWLPEPMLVAHSLYSYYGGPICSARDVETEAALIERFGTEAPARGASVAALVNVPEQRRSTLERLEAQGYTTSYLSAVMTMEVPYGSFESYLAALPPKHRQTIRAADRRATAAGATAAVVEGVPPLEELKPLEQAILEHHGHADVDLYPTEYLAAVERHMKDELRCVLVWTPEGSLSCFMLLFLSGDAMTGWVAGIDYGVLRQYEPYHHAFRTVIRYAIEHGVTRLDMGRGSWRFKHRYGYRPTPVYVAMRGNSRRSSTEVERWCADLSEFALRERQEESAKASAATSRTG